MARNASNPLRWLCSKLHLYVGLTLGVVLVVLSVTGSALVFRDALERWVEPELYHVTPRGTPVAVDSVLHAVQKAHPSHPPRLVRLPADAEAPYKVWLQGDAERQAYVDPYDGTLLGTRHAHSGVMGTIFVLHAELLAGTTGAWIVGLSGLLLALLCLTGLVLWWPRVGHIKRALVVAYRHSWKRLNYDLHRAGGFWTLLFVLVVGLTGSAMIFYNEAGALLNTVTGSAALPPPPTSSPSKQEVQFPISEAIQQARNALPEARVTFVYLPQTPEAPLTIRLRTEGEWHPNGRSFAYFDQYSGELLRADDARQAPLGTRLLHTLYPLHIGAVGGPLVRILYVILGLAPAVLSVTGTVIWYNRWRKQHRRFTENGSADLPERPAARPVKAPPFVAKKGENEKIRG